MFAHMKLRRATAVVLGGRGNFRSTLRDLLASKSTAVDGRIVRRNRYFLPFPDVEQ